MKRNRPLKLSNALMKGLLLWAPAYAAGAGSSAYWLTRLLTDRKPVYTDILADALMIFMPWGLLAGAAKWVLIRHRRIGRSRLGKTGRYRNRFTSARRPSRLRPKTV